MAKITAGISILSDTTNRELQDQLGKHPDEAKVSLYILPADRPFDSNHQEVKLRYEL